MFTTCHTCHSTVLAPLPPIKRDPIEGFICEVKRSEVYPSVKEEGTFFVVAPVGSFHSIKTLPALAVEGGAVKLVHQPSHVIDGMKSGPSIKLAKDFLEDLNESVSRKNNVALQKHRAFIETHL